MVESAHCTAAAAAKEAVDGVVHTVGVITAKEQQLQRAQRAHAALEEEKRRVQKLINGLAAKVADQGAASPHAAATPSESVEEAAAAAATPTAGSSPVGVRLDDHRVFHLRGTPISWTQSSDSVTVYLALPGWVRAEHVEVKLESGAIFVRVQYSHQYAATVEVEQPLFGGIDPDASMWMLEGGGERSRYITLELEKARIRWWSRLFMNDDPAAYVAVDEREHALALSNAPGSPLSPPAPPPPSDETSYVTEPLPPDHPPPHNALPPTPADGAAPPAPADTATPPPAGTASPPVTSVVRQVVDDIVEQAVRDVPQPDAAAEDGVVQAASGTTRRQPRTVTTDDVHAMLKKNIAEVEAGGKNAAAAALQVGMVYWHAPYGIERRQALAAKYLLYGLQRGALDANAAFQLGMIYNSGADGWEPNASQAVRWWALAAELGHAVAMFNLGVMKMNGTGCDLDPIGALQLFHAANAANPRLKPPALPRELIAERMAMADRLRKQKAKRNMSAEEKDQRRDAAVRDLKLAAMGTASVAALAAGAFAFRHWWKNTL